MWLLMWYRPGNEWGSFVSTAFTRSAVDDDDRYKLSSSEWYNVTMMIVMSAVECRWET
jgi:hypothetical protein